MPVMTVEHKGNYTVVSNELIRDSNLSLKAKGMMLLVLSLPPVWEFTIEGMTAICKEGKDSIQKTFCELEQYGYLKRNRIRDKGKIADVEYNFFEEPKPVIPSVVSPYPGKPDEVKPDEVNPSQLNKEVINKDKLNSISKEIENSENSPVKKKKNSTKKNTLENPSAEGNKEILRERSENKNPTTPLPPAAPLKGYPAVMAYIDSLPHPDSFKAILKKWYDACGRGKINEQQLKDKLKTAYVECGKDITLLEKAVINAYENGYRAFYAPKNTSGYKHTNTTNEPHRPSAKATDNSGEELFNLFEETEEQNKLFKDHQLELAEKMREKINQKGE